MLTIKTPTDVHNAIVFQNTIVKESTETRRPNTDRYTKRHTPELHTYVFRGYIITQQSGGRNPMYTLHNPSGDVIINNQPWIVITNYLWCVFDGV